MFDWNEKFSVNNREIDSQHMKLFDIGKKIYEVASIKDDYDHFDMIMEAINELRSYTDYHFKYEEKVMQDYGYEDYEAHHFEHVFFIKKLDKIASSEIDDMQSETALDIVEFVANWIEGHILRSDSKYKIIFK